MKVVLICCLWFYSLCCTIGWIVKYRMFLRYFFFNNVCTTGGIHTVAFIIVVFFFRWSYYSKYFWQTRLINPRFHRNIRFLVITGSFGCIKWLIIRLDCFAVTWIELISVIFVPTNRHQSLEHLLNQFIGRKNFSYFIKF